MEFNYRPPVYNQMRLLVKQFNQSTVKVPVRYKYTNVIPLHNRMIEIMRKIMMFANDTEPHIELLNEALKLVDDVKLNVRLLYDLHYIKKKGFMAISREEAKVEYQLRRWYASLTENNQNNIL